MRICIAVRWIALLILVALLVTCNPRGPVDILSAGEIIRTEYDLSDFDEISVAGFFDAEIKQGSDFQVVVECEKALVPYLKVRVRGGRLEVGLDPTYQYNFEEASQRLVVTVPGLLFVQASNHSTLQMDNFRMEEPLQLEVLDFSLLLGEINAINVHIDVSNHSTLTLEGSTVEVTGEVTDMSVVNLDKLNAETIDVEVDGKSTLRQ